MHTVNIIIAGVESIVNGPNILTAGTDGLSKITFSPDGAWDGLTLSGVFANGKLHDRDAPKNAVCYTQTLDSSNSCSVPIDVLRQARQSVFIWLTGTDSSGKTLISSAAKFVVVPGLDITGDSAVRATGVFTAEKNYYRDNPVIITHSLGRTPSYFFMCAVDGVSLPEKNYTAVVAIGGVIWYGDSIVNITGDSETSTKSLTIYYINSSGTPYSQTASSLITVLDGKVSVQTNSTAHYIQAGSTWAWFAF